MPWLNKAGASWKRIPDATKSSFTFTLELVRTWSRTFIYYPWTSPLDSPRANFLGDMLANTVNHGDLLPKS